MFSWIVFGVSSVPLSCSNLCLQIFAFRNMDCVKLVPSVCILIGIFTLCFATSLDSEQLHKLEVSCNSSGMIAKVFFESEFSGAVYAQGNFFNPSCKCVIRKPQSSMFLFIPINDCGTIIQELNGDRLISNTIVVQKHQLIETTWDVLYNVSCKILAAQVSNSKELEGDESLVYQISSLKSWMEFRLDLNILSSKEALKLSVGDDFYLLIYLKDSGQNKDMQVQRCWVYEGETIDKSHYILEIFDSFKCEPSVWVSDFCLERGVGNDSDTYMTYAKLKAFKFSTTVNLHFTCSIKVCQEACENYCDISETERNISSRKMKRSVPEIYSDKSFRERYRLMKATVKALGDKLLERNRSKNDSSFRRRLSDSARTELPQNDQVILITTTDQETLHIASNTTQLQNSTNYSYYDITETSLQAWNYEYLFNVTNKIEVLTVHEFNIKYNGRGFSRVSSCISEFKFGLIVSTMGFTVLFLILVIVALVLYLRKEKKKHLIDNFLLYNLN